MHSKLSLEKILLYSQCPKKYSFDLHQIKKNTIDSNKLVIKNLIKQIYINKTKDGFTTSWETIKARINKICFEPVDINNKEQFNIALKRAESLLSIMHGWYYKYYLNQTVQEGLVNIPLERLVSKTTITHTYDLVVLNLKHKAIPVIFDTITNPHNNLYLKAMVWLLSKELKEPINKIELWDITSTKVDIVSLYNKTDIEYIDKCINFITRSIEFKIFYPAVSEQCNSCEWKNVCTI